MGLGYEGRMLGDCAGAFGWPRLSLKLDMSCFEKLEI